MKYLKGFAKCVVFIGILALSCCSVPNRSILQGTYDDETFTLEGEMNMLSRRGNGTECTQGIDFYPAYPVGDQLSFAFGFKEKDMYDGFKELINENIFDHKEIPIDKFRIGGYTDKSIEIDARSAVEGDYLIIESVHLDKKRLRTNLKELDKAVVIEGKMKVHFDELLLQAEFQFILGQCYQEGRNGNN